jgi:hypothetical protein
MIRKLARRARTVNVISLFMAVSLLLVLRPSLNQAGAAGLSVWSGPQALVQHSKLPLIFESNHGQTDPKVKFISRSNDFTLLLADEETVLALRVPSRAGILKPTASASPTEAQATIADWQRSAKVAH